MRRRMSRALAAVQALVNRVVLAVDRQHGDAAPARAIHDDRAGHHEDLLVGERDGLAAVDGGEDGVERGGPRRGEEHDIGVRVRRDGNQPLRPARHRRRQRCSQAPQAGLHLGKPAGRGHGDRVGRVLRDLLDEPRHVLSRRERHDLQAIGMRRHDGERALADGAGRSEDGDTLHDACRYRVKT